jgi:beta-lactamase class A
MSSVSRSWQVRILSVLCLLLLLGNIGWLVRGNDGNKGAQEFAAARREFPFLSPRILADSPNDILINFVPLRKALTEKFDKLQVQKSFYFEYLPDGTSIRIGGDQQLTAASLIKVPLAMNLYKAAELGRINLDEKVTVTAFDLDQAYGEVYKKGAGYQLTLREAARHMLEDSDNTAARVVFNHMKDKLKYEEQSLARLDVEQNFEDGQAVITARAYSSVLKGLYFAAYLNNEHSQELLGYLSKSTATNRISRDLPNSVKVAHKIGVYNANWAESDCGIVYVPKRPYVLCVMVGLPEDEADKFIAEISKDIYDFVVEQR